MFARRGWFASDRTPEERLRPIMIAAWFMILAVLGELAMQALRIVVFQRAATMHPQVVWLTLLAQLLVFSVPLLIVLVVSRMRAAGVSLRSTVLVFAWLGLLGPLFHFRYRLHAVALAVVAAGLAVQIAYFAGKHSAGFRKLVRRTTPTLTAVLLTAGIVTSAVTRRPRGAGLLESPRGDAPNILLIILDTVRGHSMSLLGYPRSTTPRLQALAARGVSFTRAMATTSWTLPSHATMFTGRYPHELLADWFTPFDDSVPALADELRLRGYDTAGFVANFIYGSREFGLHRGFQHYEAYTLPAAVVKQSPLLETIAYWSALRELVGYRELIGRKRAGAVNASFLRWLDRPHERPFFVFLNYFDAHQPYLPPEPFARRFRAIELAYPLPEARSGDRVRSREELRGMIDGYDAAIATIDDRLGQLFDELEARGLDENTLMIITSDHGEELGEHGYAAGQHGNGLYLTQLWVPLVILFPGRVPSGLVVAEPVTLRDLPATIADLAGLEQGLAFPGTSLARHWRATPDSGTVASPLLASMSQMIGALPHYQGSKGDMRSILANGWHYIDNGDGTQEIYDYERDLFEKRNLAATPEGASALSALREMLLALTGRGGPGR